uniref:Reverse transcriptase domain-containing protein n=1 Tax=Callorhinchus milii TaxID=7868 RepID=A0A4W3JJ52_CALMI
MDLSGIAFAWFKSYLTNCQHYISANGFSLRFHLVTCGVPQESILGPLLFLIYMLPLSDVFCRYGVNFHMYADDTQLYVSASSCDPQSPEVLRACLSDIRSWMSANFLQLNVNRTEAILFGSHRCLLSHGSDLFNATDLSLKLSEPVRNLDVRFNLQLSFLPHIQSMTSTAFLHLIAQLQQYLTPKTAKTLFHAFVTSRLDYSNPLLAGLPSSTIHKIQLFENSTACILTRTKHHQSLPNSTGFLSHNGLTSRSSF